jgi:hypothetical protein
MEVTYAICRVSIAPLRATASDRAEIVSQLLFGDYLQVLQKTDKWYWVQSAFDGYLGWVDYRQLAVISEEEHRLEGRVKDFLVPAGVQHAVQGPDGSSYYLASASSLPNYKDGACYLGTQRFEVPFQPLEVNYTQRDNHILEHALFYQNAPYLWGGRTVFGIDCSGFVQAVFKMSGLRVLRDASQQALQGVTVDFLPAAQAGDVAFFDNAEGKITHVGILLSNKEIIHASAKVRIDPIDDQGIFNKELNHYSHNLRIIKRFI